MDKRGSRSAGTRNEWDKPGRGAGYRSFGEHGHVTPVEGKMEHRTRAAGVQVLRQNTRKAILPSLWQDLRHLPRKEPFRISQPHKDTSKSRYPRHRSSAPAGGAKYRVH